jgi:hypothetical protein
MFAQNIVHDKDGNLLFFIVDNNIYNRYGEAFFKYDPEYPDEPPIYDLFSYLYDGIYGDFIDGSSINRFMTESNGALKGVLLDPEIVVFPIYGECYKYGLAYSFFDGNAMVVMQVQYITEH